MRPRPDRFAVFAALKRRATPVCLLAGALLPLAFAPYDFWPLAIFIAALVLAIWRDLGERAARKAGFAFGFGAFLTGTYWLYISVAVFGQAPTWLAIGLMLGLVLIMAVYYALTAWTIARLAGQRAGWLAWLIVCPSAWVVAEWLRGWVLSGFPWISLGYSQLSSPLAGFAPLLGVYGVSFAVVLVAALLVAAVATARVGERITFVVGAVGLLIAGAALRPVTWIESLDESLSVALVQGGIDQDKKWLPEWQLPTLERYRDFTAKNLDADVIVWPEVALPALRQQLDVYLGAIDEMLENSDTALAYGVLDVRGEPRRTSNALLTLGRGKGEFHKHHLVPFGEYFPVPGFVREWMRLQSLPYADMSAGAAEQLGISLAGFRVASSICYEDAFASEQRHFFPQAAFIVNVTNDAWFGDSIAPHHHLDIARMRSLESQRWQLRAANTGVTAVIAPDGSVTERMPQFEAGVVRGEIGLRQGATPYVILGNTPLVLLLSLLLGFFEIRRRRRL